jgi:hypothetical protein
MILKKDPDFDLVAYMEENEDELESSESSGKDANVRSV